MRIIAAIDNRMDGISVIYTSITSERKIVSGYYSCYRANHLLSIVDYNREADLVQDSKM